MGLELVLDSVAIAIMIIPVCISIMDYGERRTSLLDALRAVRQNNVADDYEDYLKTTVSYIVHISMYTCT